MTARERAETESQVQRLLGRIKRRVRRAELAVAARGEDLQSLSYTCEFKLWLEAGKRLSVRFVGKDLESAVTGAVNRGRAAALTAGRSRMLTGAPA